MNIRLTLLALAACAALTDAAAAQAIPKCGDPDQQEVIAEWLDLAADADGFFDLDADGLHVEPEFWAALDLTQKKTLMIGADVYHECVIWPDLIDNGDDPAKRMWLCGIEVWRRDADWDDWRNPPKPIAETLPGLYGGCEFRIDGVPVRSRSR